MYRDKRWQPKNRYVLRSNCSNLTVWAVWAVWVLCIPSYLGLLGKSIHGSRSTVLQAVHTYVAAAGW